MKDYREKFRNELKAFEASKMETVEALAQTVEARDPCTRGHSERVASYAVTLASEIKMDRKKIQLLRHCCRLHDIGKIAVTDRILTKPGKLTMDERAEIQMHSIYGKEILEGLQFMKQGLPIILHHHERYDGKGYPYGLKRDAISLEVRILSIADAYDAMSSVRPYRQPLSRAQVIEELKRNSGTQFDPHLAKVFLHLIDRCNASAEPHRRAA